MKMLYWLPISGRAVMEEICKSGPRVARARKRRLLLNALNRSYFLQSLASAPIARKLELIART